MKDTLLTAQDVATRLGVSVGWLYRNGKTLPFRVKVSHKQVRYSLDGLRKWIRSGGRKAE